MKQETRHDIARNLYTSLPSAAGFTHPVPPRPGARRGGAVRHKQTHKPTRPIPLPHARILNGYGGGSSRFPLRLQHEEARRNHQSPFDSKTKAAARKHWALQDAYKTEIRLHHHNIAMHLPGTAKPEQEEHHELKIHMKPPAQPPVELVSKDGGKPQQQHRAIAVERVSELLRTLKIRSLEHMPSGNAKEVRFAVTPRKKASHQENGLGGSCKLTKETQTCHADRALDLPAKFESTPSDTNQPTPKLVRSDASLPAHTFGKQHANAEEVTEFSDEEEKRQTRLRHKLRAMRLSLPRRVKRFRKVKPSLGDVGGHV